MVNIIFQLEPTENKRRAFVQFIIISSFLTHTFYLFDVFNSFNIYIYVCVFSTYFDTLIFYRHIIMSY